ncbi:DUF3035 domain-containing protein [Pseudoroseicyclus aestuarii]|uniref:Beta-barrel assembly complex subunit BamF n=1 Tax=Pseudoroseicyclus aestuarii TaxID=1795041 RepID=A0A318SSA6_9RHOB|nr:DUF3035 domain-containing protein [Pseudoroseicyclus aestuarii]PYE84710.1 beta-barrel assembly complex subunit BamF [Pseudoroseicyclus aestuarii]
MRTTHIIAALCALALVSGCNRTRGGGGPDEFSVLPSDALQIPDVLSLPQPTPGGTNRTDRTPTLDAVARLGGSPSGSGIPASDAALLAAAGAPEPQIRATLAGEAAARQGGARPGTARYYGRFAAQRLDAPAELARWRAAGAATPSAPPRD